MISAAVDLLKEEHARHPDSKYLFPSPLTGEMYHDAGFTLRTCTHATRQAQEQAAAMGQVMAQIL